MPLPTAPPDTVDRHACDYARIVLDHDPVTATALGLHDRDGDLPPVTRESLEAYRRDLRELLRRVEQHDTADDREADLDRRGVMALLALDLFGLEVLRPRERNPLVWSQTPAEGVLLLLLRTQALGEGVNQHILQRTAAVPAYLSSGMRLLDPRDVPPAWAHAAQGAALGSAAFFRDILPQAVPEAEAAAGVAAESLQAFAAWLESEVAPVAAGRHAVGEHHMAHLLQRHHLLETTPAELLARGEALAADFDERMVAVAGGQDPWQRYEEIKRHHPSPEQLIPTYQAEFERLRTFCLDSRLVTDPRTEARLTATPEFLRPLMGYAAYLPPGPFDEGVAGELWVTPPGDDAGLSDHSFAAIGPVTAHEGYPGHHLQMASVNRLPSPVRRLTISNLMVEGWGLYVEELMAEVGYYDEDARLAQLSMSKLRAVRIIIDIGLHSGDLDIEQAARLLVDDAGLGEGVARSEVLRYTMMPTQPSSYLIGAEEIRRIRARLSDDDPTLTLQGFHDRLLSYGHLTPALAAEGLGAAE